MMRKSDLRVENNLQVMTGTAEEGLEIIDEQIDYSTADIEASIFCGDYSPYLPKSKPYTKRGGLYRIIDGQLFQVLHLSPPGSVPLRKNSGLFGMTGDTK